MARTPDGVRGMRILALSVAAGLALAWVIGAATARFEHDRYESAFQEAATARLAALGGSLNTTLEVAETIVSFFNASQNVDRDEFAIFVSHVLSEHGGIQAVEWIPRVTALERAGHEQLARSEGLGQYRITERDGGGALVIAADRPEYFPVYYLEPLVGNEAALGFDLASSPTRLAALEKARDTGTVVASAKISLVQGGGARPGVLIFAPIYRTGTPTQSVENRRESLEGYALAVLDIERTLANAINFSEAVDGPGFDVAVFDLSAAQGDQLVHAISADPGAPAPTRQALQSGVHSGVEILVGDRTWLVISTPSGPKFSPLMTPQPRAAGVPVFLIVFLIGVYIRAMTARNFEIQNLVADRTETLNAILNTVNDGIITIDSLGVIQTFNVGASRIFGYAADEVIGKNVRMLMPEPYRGEHHGYLNRFLTTGEPRVIGLGREVFGQRKDGTVFPMSLAVGEMPIAGKRMFAGVARDITELKAVEGLKNEFVSTVSHELRTPLTSIKGALGLVRSGVTGDLPDRMTAMLEIAYANSDRLISLINDILDIEKIEAGKMVFRMEPVDLSDIVAKSVEANRTIGEHRSVVLTFNENPPD